MPWKGWMVSGHEQGPIAVQRWNYFQKKFPTSHNSKIEELLS
jgi:hypothetical protein